MQLPAEVVNGFPTSKKPPIKLISLDQGYGDTASDRVSSLDRIRKEAGEARGYQVHPERFMCELESRAERSYERNLDIPSWDHACYVRKWVEREFNRMFS